MTDPVDTFEVSMHNIGRPKFEELPEDTRRQFEERLRIQAEEDEKRRKQHEEEDWSGSFLVTRKVDMERYLNSRYIIIHLLMMEQLTQRLVWLFLRI
jgi:hypothetical protein